MEDINLDKHTQREKKTMKNWKIKEEYHYAKTSANYLRK